MKRQKILKSGGGWQAAFYIFKRGRSLRGTLRLLKALWTRNTCKTCAVGMGGQRGAMVNEQGHFPSVCKKSIQAMAADLEPGIPAEFFEQHSINELRQMSSRELEAAGRLTQPLHLAPGDDHYRPIDWGRAVEIIAGKLKATAPEETFFYMSGRSSNEAAFLVQLFARCYGTNNVTNCSYYCHQASGVGLSSVTGSGTATVDLAGLEQCDLLFVIGGNPASNHPRLMTSMLAIRRRGGKVIFINPLREAGLMNFKIPSDVRSMLFGSEIASDYFQPNIGGDIALLAGMAKALIAWEALDRNFIAEHTAGWSEFEAEVTAMAWEEIEAQAGLGRAEIERAARHYAESKNAIFAWTMGITHHLHGVENVQMIANLALLRGMLGRPAAGLLPIRGHSNVQGIGSVGVTPKLKEAVFQKLEQAYGLKLPTQPGLDSLGCLEAAHAGKMRFALCLGGNLYGASPDATFTAEAFARTELVTYMNTSLNTGHAWGTGRETVILPVLARDEEAQTTTQESMFNYVRLSEGGARRHQGPNSEASIIAALARTVLGEASPQGGPVNWRELEQHVNIRAMIAKIIPGYEAIGKIDATKEEFTVGGRVFEAAKFATPDARAHFHAIALPGHGAPAAGQLRLMTIRSEGQFNTVVFEEEDRYRGQERRDVILMSADDVQALVLAEDQRVTVRGEAGEMRGILVRTIDIPRGNAVMYYPEANVLLARSIDPASRTPAFKHGVVTLQAEAGAAENGKHDADIDTKKTARQAMKAC